MRGLILVAASFITGVIWSSYSKDYSFRFRIAVALGIGMVYGTIALILHA